MDTAYQIIIVIFSLYFANHMYFTYFLNFPVNIFLLFQIFIFDSKHINEVLNKVDNHPS